MVAAAGRYTVSAVLTTVAAAGRSGDAAAAVGRKTAVALLWTVALTGPERRRCRGVTLRVTAAAPDTCHPAA